MATRVLIGSEGARITRPGVDVYNPGHKGNILVDINGRTGQIIRQGSFPLVESTTQSTSSGGLDIGPYESVPDVIYQFYFSDGRARNPPMVFMPDINGYFFFSTSNVLTVTASRIDCTVSNAANAAGARPAFPTYCLFYLFRKANFT